MMKGVFEGSLTLSPLMYLVVGVAGGLVTIAIILLLLVTHKPKIKPAETDKPKRFRDKAAREAGAILHMFVPAPIARGIGRGLGAMLRPVVNLGRRGVDRLRSSDSDENDDY